MHCILIIVVLYMTELENLWYTAFAFGYFQDDTQYASTTTAKYWASPPNIEYLHDVIVAGGYISLGKCDPFWEN